MATACRTWAAVWANEDLQYAYDTGVFQGVVVFDGLMGMAEAIRQAYHDRQREADRHLHDCTCPASWGEDYCDCRGGLDVASVSRGTDHG
jgi:hypothetical protein